LPWLISQFLPTDREGICREGKLISGSGEGRTERVKEELGCSYTNISYFTSMDVPQAVSYFFHQFRTPDLLHGELALLSPCIS
jgi:hypothetical protein